MWELLRLAEQHSAHFRCMEACDALAAARKLASRDGVLVEKPIGYYESLLDGVRSEGCYLRHR